MSGEKATFESRDVTGLTPSKDDEEMTYLGPERRRVNRRTGKERRGEVRFEFGKEDRRKNHGRRGKDCGPDFW